MMQNYILKTWVVNDGLVIVEDDLSMRIMDFNGEVIWKDSKKIKVDSLSRAIKFQIDLKAIPFHKNETVLVSTFSGETAYFYSAKPKYLALKVKEIQKKITKTEDGFAIQLTSEILQKDVFLFTETRGHFSDNFIDLLPNQSVVIKYKTESETLDDLQLKSFNSFIR